MTVCELQKLLADIVLEQPTVADSEVQVEGCDCTGEAVGISFDTERDTLYVRRGWPATMSDEPVITPGGVLDKAP